MALRTARFAALVALSLLAPALVTLATRDAWAQPASRPTLVVAGDGAASQRIAADLGAALPDPWILGDPDAFARALGQRGGIGAALANATAREALVKKARTAAGSAGATAVLLVRVTPVKNGRSVRLVLVSANDAAPAVDTSVLLGASDIDAVRAAVAPALTRLSPPPSTTTDTSPPSGRAAPPPVAPPPPSDASPPAGAGPILVLSVGGGSGTRVFRYHDGLSDNLRPYDLPASANVAAAIEVYPFARLAVPVLRGVGLTGGFQYAPGLASQDSTGTSVSTTWMHIDGGLRVRLPFGDQDRFVLGVAGGIVKERFVFGTSTLLASLPNVDYLFGRFAVDGRLRLGPVALLAGVGYLPAMAGGDLADRFRQTSFAGLELSAGLAVPIGTHFELRAAGTYTRVFYAFKPNVGDAYVAGGALDHLIRAQVFATLVL